MARLRVAGAPFVNRFEDLLTAVCEAEGILTSPRRVQLCHRACGQTTSGARRAAVWSCWTGRTVGPAM